MRVGKELVQEADDHRVVGQSLQGSGHVTALPLGQGFGLVVNAEGVFAHFRSL